jgi:hypothetical protein
MARAFKKAMARRRRQVLEKAILKPSQSYLLKLSADRQTRLNKTQVPYVVETHHISPSSTTLAQTLSVRIVGRCGSAVHKQVIKLSSSYLLGSAPAQTHRLIIRRRRYNILQRMTIKLLLDYYPTIVVL